MEPTGDHDDGLVSRVPHRRPHPARHVLLARRVTFVRGGRAAKQVEVLGHALRFGLALEEVVPQHVDVVDGELAAQPLDDLGVPQLRVGVTVADVAERLVPRGQVDEPDLGPAPACLGDRHPLRRVVAERRPRRVLVGVAEQGDGELVAQQELVDALVEVGGTFDEHVRGLLLVDGGGDQPGTGGTVVPDADEHGPHQPGSR